MPVDPRILRAAGALQQQQAMRAAVAQRSLGGQGASGRGVQVGPVGAQRAGTTQAKATQAVQDNAWEQAKAQYKATATPQGGGGGGGIGGFLGKAVNVAIKPLELLQIPKNIVQTGILELEQALTESNKTPHWMRFLTVKPEQMNWFTPPDEVRAGRSNLDLIMGKPGVYKGQVKGPLGFGQMVQDLNTGNNLIDTWGDRAIGLAGDIGLDPLTHLMPGVDKIPGATGRARLALEATARNLSPEVVDAARTGGARAVRKLGDQAAIDALQLPETGLKFGTREASWRIPGTGKIDEALASLRNAVRSPLVDTPLGEMVRRFGVSRDPKLRAAFESLVRHGGGEFTPAAAAKEILSREAGVAEGRLATSAAENLAQDIAHKAGADPSITHAYEAGDLSHPAAQQLDELARGLHDLQVNKGASVGEHLDKPYIKHLPTDAGHEIFGHETSNVPGFAATGPHAEDTQFSRVFKPGETYKIAGETFKPVTASIEEINGWAAAHGLPKLMEDNPGKLAAHMVLDASNTIENATYLRGLAQEGPYRQLFSGADPRATTLDMAATRAASKGNAEGWIDKLNPALQGLVDTNKTGAAVQEAQMGLGAYERGATRALGEARGPAALDIGERQQQLAQLLSDQPEINAQRAALQGPLTEARGAEASAQGMLDAAGSPLQGPQMTSPLVQPQVDQLQAQFEQLKNVVRTQLEQGNEQAARNAMVRARDTQNQLQDLARRYAVPVEGAVAPERAGLEQALTEAAGRRQALEAQAAPIEARFQAQQAAQPINIGAEAELATAVRAGALAQGGAPFRQYLFATQLADLETRALHGVPLDQIEQQIQRLPEHAQDLVRSTIHDDFDVTKMAKLQDDIRQGMLDDVIIREANDGFTRLATDPIIGRDLYATDEAKRLMGNWNKAMDAARSDPTLLGRIIDEQVQFFKSWALATPGQHIRNGMAATFMNISEGVSLSEMRGGNAIFRAWRSASFPERVSGEWVKTLPEQYQAVAPDVLRAVYASGAGGRYTAAEIGARAFGEDTKGGTLNRLFRKTYENRITEGSHNIGERWVEGPVRAGLALHVIGEDGSGSLTEAIGRIKRIHFDYSDVNEVDAKLRRVIPFWTFMSRNLPLQVQQMWTNPKAYSWYQSLMNNVEGEQPGAPGMPTWLSDMGARFAAPGLAFNPDIGPSQVTDTFGQFTHPTRLLSNLNPAFKSIVELGMNRSTFYDQPYKANDYVKPGVELTPFLPMLRAAGKVQDTAQGPVVERKYLDQISSNLPLLGTINRLGSTSSDRSGKGLNALFGFLGAPLRQVDTAKELENQKYAQSGDRYNAAALRKALLKYNRGAA